MRKLGEQWVEEIDGQEHMVKLVKSTTGCSGCAWHLEHDDCIAFPFVPCTYNESIIKDLGVVNEDGLLPCPFCKEYPELVEESDENDEAIYTVEHECSVLIEAGWWHDRQQAIDAWNRRV
jgi:hypothetical protein